METVNLDMLKDEIITNVYLIDRDKVVPLHRHTDQDEVFYCIKGSGYGVLEESEIELSKGQTFIAYAGIMHSLRTDSNLYVASFLIPAVK